MPREEANRRLYYYGSTPTSSPGTRQPPTNDDRVFTYSYPTRRSSKDRTAQEKKVLPSSTKPRSERPPSPRRRSRATVSPDFRPRTSRTDHKHSSSSQSLEPAPGELIVAKPDSHRKLVLVARPSPSRRRSPSQRETYHTAIRRPDAADSRHSNRLELHRHNDPVDSAVPRRADKNPRKGHSHRASDATIMSAYNNAVLTLVPHATGDPFVAYALGKFYLTFTLGDRIEIWRSDTLEGFMTTGDKITIFRAPPDTDHSQGLWAPELHDIGGRWYVLYTAEDPKIGIDSHRMFVLGGPPSNVDPCIPHDAKDSPWQDLGHIGGMRTDQWAIDGTYFWADGGLYMAYSGSPLGIHPAQAKVQELFVVHMASPTSADSPPSLISSPTESYEYSGDRGVNEGPQWLTSPDGRWRGLVISVSGTWTQDYKMLPLTYNGGNPLDPRAWHKWRKPLCEKGRGMRGPFGPGHGNFINVNGETIAVFHATDGPRDGFENRKARAQRVAWTHEGPNMGGHVGPVVPDVGAFNDGPTKAQRDGNSKRSSRQRWDDLKQGYKYWTSGW